LNPIVQGTTTARIRENAFRCDCRKVLARSDRTLVLQKGQVVLKDEAAAVAADSALANDLGV
jgi:ABC-type branched-subunit amino acid transport system ATPase component